MIVVGLDWDGDIDGPLTSVQLLAADTPPVVIDDAAVFYLGRPHRFLNDSSHWLASPEGVPSDSSC